MVMVIRHCYLLSFMYLFLSSLVGFAFVTLFCQKYKDLVCAHMHDDTHRHLCSHAHTCTHTHTHMHAHTHTNTHTPQHNTHTCTHTHMFHKPLFLSLAACVVCCCCSLRFLTMCSSVVVAGLCAIGLISMQV